MYNLLWKFQPQATRTRPVYVALDRAFSLIEKIEELKVEKLTSPTPILLLDIFDEVVKVCIDKLLDIEKELADRGISELELERKENQVRAVARKLNKIHAYLRYIYATKLDRNPSGMVLPWELLVNKYHPDAKTIIRPQWEWNYKYIDIMRELKRLVEDISPKIKDILAQHDKFPVFSFPGLERENILLHVILAHEIGHFIDDASKLSDNPTVTAAISFDMEKVNRFTNLEIEISEVHKTPSPSALSEEQLDLFKALRAQAIASQVKSLIEAHINKWLKELTAGIIALRIIGPAYLFALSQAALCELSMHQIAGHYPPPIQRLIKILNECKSGKPRHYEFFQPTENDNKEIRKIKDATVKHFQNIEDVEKKTSIEEGSAVSQDLPKQRELLLADLIATAIEGSIGVIKELIYKEIPNDKAYRLETSIFDQIKFLQKQITPNQKILSEGNELKFEPFSMESILNAGWIFWLTHKKDVKHLDRSEVDPQKKRIKDAEEKYYKPLEEVSRLILRAIELSDFHNRFIKEREARGTS